MLHVQDPNREQDLSVRATVDDCCFCSVLLCSALFIWSHVGSELEGWADHARIDHLQHFQA